MKANLLLLALGAALLGSCSKSDTDTPKPAQPAQADLLGVWQMDSTWTHDGTVAGRNRKDNVVSFVGKGARAEFTATTYLLYVGSMLEKAVPYTRNGAILQVGSPPEAVDTIRTLNAKRLVLVGAEGSVSTALRVLTFHR